MMCMYVAKLGYHQVRIQSRTKFPMARLLRDVLFRKSLFGLAMSLIASIRRYAAGSVGCLIRVVAHRRQYSDRTRCPVHLVGRKRGRGVDLE